MHNWAFVPDTGPPRLIRMVEAGTLPDRDLVALYDQANNLLIVDRENFAQLTPYQQESVLRTHKPALTLQTFGLGKFTLWPETTDLEMEVFDVQAAE